MLGVAAAEGCRSSSDAADGRGHRRQHVRLHRRGEEGVDRHHLRARRVQEGRRLQEARRHAAASRSATRASSPRRCPRSTTSSARATCSSSARCSTGERRADARRQPRRLGRPRERPARRHAVARERVPEDRRGVQPHLRLLHHPAVSRQAALAHRRRRRRARPSSSSRSGVIELNLDLAGHGRLRARPARRTSGRDARRRSCGASPT